MVIESFIFLYQIETNSDWIYEHLNSLEIEQRIKRYNLRLGECLIIAGRVIPGDEFKRRLNQAKGKPKNRWHETT